MDEKDYKIIEVLKDNADFPTRKIAKKTLLPITTVHNRIRKLKQEKVIKKFTVDLDHKKMGRGLLVYVLIDVDIPWLNQNKVNQFDLVKKIRSFYFVDEVHVVTGGTDMVAAIRVKNVEEFNKVLLSKLQRIPGIQETTSLVVIDS